MTPDEIEDECLDNNHDIRLSVIEQRAYAVVCPECQAKIQAIENDGIGKNESRH